MANYQFSQATLTLSFLAGQNEEGKSVFKKATYRNIKEQITAQQLSDVARAIGTLSSLPLADVEKTEKQFVI